MEMAMALGGVSVHFCGRKYETVPEKFSTKIGLPRCIHILTGHSSHKPQAEADWVPFPLKGKPIGP